MEPNPYQAPENPGPATRAAIPQERYEALLEENKKYNNISLLTGGIGLVLQLFPSLMLKLLGTLLLIMGLSFYMRMKGRSPAWGLLGFLSILGFIMAALLPKYCRGCGEQESKKVCRTCGAPVGI